MVEASSLVRPGVSRVLQGIRRLIALTLVALPGAVSTFAAPQSEPWPLWEAHDPDSVQQIDHSAWDSFLEGNLVAASDGGPNLMAYGLVSKDDRQLLDSYISTMGAVPVSSLSRDEQFAFWVNLYNALTVRLILEHYPLDSIRSISRPWDRTLIHVEGTELSLNDIEHRILRPIWNDPRIHYAVNCASIGCPELQPRAFDAENLEPQLDEAAFRFINSARAADLSSDPPVFSSIYDWYQEDFGGSVEAVLNHMSMYARGENAEALRRLRDSGSRVRLRFSYDWSLNEPPQRP